jgi:N-methylhydantoinase B
VSLSSERQHVAAGGAGGGGAGATGAFILNPGTPGERKLPSASGEIRLAPGDVLRVCTPAGGGYGPAARRSAELAEKDRIEQRV